MILENSPLQPAEMPAQVAPEGSGFEPADDFPPVCYSCPIHGSINTAVCDNCHAMKEEPSSDVLIAPFGHYASEPERWAYLTYEECRRLSQNGVAFYYSARRGEVVHVKITSMKMWIKRRDIEIHWKYGLYQYGFEKIDPSTPQKIFVRREK
jgi:hypothetical protein